MEWAKAGLIALRGFGTACEEFSGLQCFWGGVAHLSPHCWIRGMQINGSQSNVIIYSGPRKLSLALIWWMIAYLYFLELESQSSSGNCNRSFMSVLSGVDGGCPNKLGMWTVSLFKSNTSGEDYLHWHVQSFNKQTEKKNVCYKPNFILVIL